MTEAQRRRLIHDARYRVLRTPTSVLETMYNSANPQMIQELAACIEEIDSLIGEKEATQAWIDGLDPDEFDMTADLQHGQA